MKISAFTCVTNPKERQDPYLESIASVADFADEIVIVNGGSQSIYDEVTNYIKKPKTEIKEVFMPWPYEWDWSELPKHLNFGLRNCTGNWAIRFDIDYMFHKNTWDELVRRIDMYKDKRVLTFQKFSSVLSTRFFQKGGMPLGINLEYKDMAIGRPVDAFTDLCYPIVASGVDDDGVITGRAIQGKEMGRTGISVFNYDYCFKTEGFTRTEFFRFSRAYERYFHEWAWGETEEKSFEVFINMMRGRLKGCAYSVPWRNQPEFIREKIRDLQPSQFGYNGWGKL